MCFISYSAFLDMIIFRIFLLAKLAETQIEYVSVFLIFLIKATKKVEGYVGPLLVYKLLDDKNIFREGYKPKPSG